MRSRCDVPLISRPDPSRRPRSRPRPAGRRLVDGALARERRSPAGSAHDAVVLAGRASCASCGAGPPSAGPSPRSRACWRACSSTDWRSSSAASASGRALSADSSDARIFAWRSSIALFRGGSTHLEIATMRMIVTASSMKNVPLGNRKTSAVVMLLSVSGQSRGATVSGVGRATRCSCSEHVDEHDHEQQVDEVHRLHEADRQEEVLTGLGLDLGLAGDRGDRLRAGEAVADRSADGAAAEGEAAADQRAGGADAPSMLFAAMFPVLF